MAADTAVELVHNRVIDETDLITILSRDEWNIPLKSKYSVESTYRNTSEFWPKIWTDPAIKARNEGKKGAYGRDMGHIFFDLYKNPNADEYVLCVGRLGNTQNLLIRGAC